MPTAPIVTDSDGKTWYIWDFQAKFAYPFDPDAPVFLLAAPPGGAGVANAPFLIKGDSGLPALIDADINLTELEYDDPTPGSATFTELTPGSDVASQISRLNLVIHKGAPGVDGTSTLDPTDYGTPVAKRILVVNSGANGFEYSPQRIGGRYWPTAINEAGAGTTAGYTQATIAIGANTIPYDWQPRVFGTAIVTGSGSDVRVDVVARLNASNGAVVGRGYGIGGVTDRLALISGPDTNASSASVTVTANTAATIYFRTEKQGGTDTYSTGASPSRFCLEIAPVAA